MDKIIREEIINVKGTTRLTVGDPMYLQNIANGTDNGCEKKLVFDGNISAAPLGRMQIRQTHIEEDGLAFDTIEVIIFQAKDSKILDLYQSGRYYPSMLKKDIDLGCDTARFTITTKFGYDEFHTGADGYYGHMFWYKQYYGMMLGLSFDTDLFEFDEIKDRMLALFPERK